MQCFQNIFYDAVMTMFMNIFTTLSKIKSKIKANCYPVNVSNKFLFCLMFMQINGVILKKHFMSVNVQIWLQVLFLMLFFK